MRLPLIRFIRFDRWRVVLVVVSMIVTLAMIVGVSMSMSLRDFATRAKKHPHREAENQYGGGEVEIGLCVLRVPLSPVMQRQGREHPDEERVGNGGGQTQQHGLPDGSANRDNERRHHCF